MSSSQSLPDSCEFFDSFDELPQDHDIFTDSMELRNPRHDSPNIDYSSHQQPPNCRLELANNSNFRGLHRVDPSKFTSLTVTSKIQVDGEEFDTDTRALSTDHISQMIKFNAYLTDLKLHSLCLHHRNFVNMLMFLSGCTQLRSLELDSLKHGQWMDRINHKVVMKKLDKFRIVDSSWFLEHLRIDEIQRLEIFRVNDNANWPWAAVNFLDSLNSLAEIGCDGNFLITEYMLCVKFKWSKAEIDLKCAETRHSTYRNVKQFIDAADNGAELSVNVNHETVKIFHRMMNDMSKNRNIAKFSLEIAFGLHFGLIDFDLSPPVESVKNLYAKLNRSYASVGEQQMRLESLLSCFPNAEVVEIANTEFAIRAEKSMKLMRNVENLSIFTWAENVDYGEFEMPQLKSLKMETMQLADWDTMKRFIDNNMQLHTLEIKKCILQQQQKNKKKISKEKLEQQISKENPNVDIILLSVE